MSLVDRFMFCGERKCFRNEYRTIFGYLEIARENGRILRGRYGDSKNGTLDIQSGGRLNKEGLDFSAVAESGWIINFHAKKNSRGMYHGDFEGPRYQGKIRMKLEKCGKDIYRKNKA